MYAVVRRWTGASALIREMERKQDEVEEIISSVPGFVAYYAIRSGDGLASITVCADRAGTDESTRRAREWVQVNVPGVTLAPPEVTGGDVFIHFDN